ncbi:MAG: GMC family oxidoreductase [Gammaproteobacteria bacterium]|nr:GMC family oxidoreductase [Gammaproteobacteria bacterium]MDE2252087.1 GMC family oxidoreductase [Gammaproteobacteria bacterium]
MIDDARDLDDGAVVQTALCIVGAGAAGITLALEFAGTGLEVLLLEAGGMRAEPRTQALYAGTVADERLHSPLDSYRQRRFGGSTTIWGGRCMPFDAIDFETRDYIPYSGWPIGLEALAPYYPRANQLCEAGACDYSATTALPGAAAPMIAGFDGAHFSSDTLERFSRPTDFGSRYRAALRAAPNVRVLVHANVTAIGASADGSAVQELQVATLTGRRCTVRAARFVLAAGGLESARLLLASRAVVPEGLGNRHGVVGRYYMCHIAGTLGRIRFDLPPAAIRHGYERDAEGIYCRRRLALRPEQQRALRVGNFIARLHHPRITDPAHRNAILSLLYLARPLIPYEYARRLHGTEQVGARGWLRHAGNVLRGPQQVLGFALHMLRERKLARRKFPSIIIRSSANLYSLDFHAEQQPNPSSRVTLGTERDELGMPRLHVDWRYRPGDIDTVAQAAALLAADFARQRLGRFDYRPEEIEAEATRYGAYGGHHIGTARMGSDPRSSVVDAHCRVHGIANLYLAGAATFTTSGQANPTLTIVALALRLAARLRAGAGSAGAG